MNTSKSAVYSRTMKVLWQSMFLVSFPFGMLSFALPIYGKELGASALEIGWFFAAFSFIPVVVRPFLGPMLDRWGRKIFLMVGFAGYLAAMILFSIADSVMGLTLARFIQGMGQAFLWLAAFTIVADVATVTGRGRNFGLIDEAANKGALIGTTAGFSLFFFLQESQDMGWEQVWPLMFVAYTLASLLALGLSWRGVSETKPPEADTPIESRPFSPQLLSLMGIVFLTGASSAMVWPMLTIFLQDKLSAGAGDLALAYLPAALLSAFLPSRLGHVGDRLGRKPPMIAGLLIGALASLLIPFLGSLVFLAIIWAIESVGYAASVPAERAFVADIAGEDMRGASYGLYTFAFFLGAALGPLAGGWLYDNVSAEMPFYLNAIILGIGALLVIVVLHESKPT